MAILREADVDQHGSTAPRSRRCWRSTSSARATPLLRLHVDPQPHRRAARERCGFARSRRVAPELPDGRRVPGRQPGPRAAARCSRRARRQTSASSATTTSCSTPGAAAGWRTSSSSSTAIPASSSCRSSRTSAPAAASSISRAHVIEHNIERLPKTMSSAGNQHYEVGDIEM